MVGEGTLVRNMCGCNVCAIQWIELKSFRKRLLEKVNTIKMIIDAVSLKMSRIDV